MLEPNGSDIKERESCHIRERGLRPSPTDGWPEGSFEPSSPPRFSKILIF